MAEPSGGFVGQLKVTPAHGPVGTPVTVAGQGFPAEQELQLVWRTVKGSWKVTPAEFHGQPNRPAHLVRSEFFTAHEELLHRLAGFEAWDQNARVVRSPFDARGKLRYSLGLSLRIVPAHMRRHLWQARQALKAISRDCTASRSTRPSSWYAPKRTSCCSAATRNQSTRRPACGPITL